MIDYLLVAINSQYIHSNLAVRYLKSYGEKYSNKKIEIYETNINNQVINIIQDIFKKNPKVVIFSTYIWNKEFVYKIVNELKKILPETLIGFGGPEASYTSSIELFNGKIASFLIKGEGERGFLKVLQSEIDQIQGVYEEMIEGSLDEIPFPYSQSEIEETHQILYYESSRGCPFSCSYCLSSIDKGVRYFSTERVKEDLGKFLKSDIRLLKFVDRTFNINRGRYLDIWKYLVENYRPGITFHFEINANILDEESLIFLEGVPNGYFQFEVGIQSINPETMDAINRRNLLDRLGKNIKRINKNIHMHLDLIAGLPYEDYNTFKKSFDYVYDLRPEMIQLGFLKILKGTAMEERSNKYNYKYLDFPPYEVLSNEFMTYDEIIKLKGIERILDFYYNSEKFVKTVEFVIKKYYLSSFDFFQELMEYYKVRNILDLGHKPVALFQYFVDFLEEKGFYSNVIHNCLKFDYLKNGKPGVYPKWFNSNKDSDIYDALIKERGYKSIREGHKNSEFEIFSYNILDEKEEKFGMFFDYIEGTEKIVKVD